MTIYAGRTLQGVLDTAPRTDDYCGHDYGKWEDDVVTPWIRKHGYVQVYFYNIDSDSFGPLIRGVKAIKLAPHSLLLENGTTETASYMVNNLEIMTMTSYDKNIHEAILQYCNNEANIEDTLKVVKRLVIEQLEIRRFLAGSLTTELIMRVLLE